MRTLNNDTTAALPARLTLTREAYARYFARSSLHRRALYCSSFVPYSFRWLSCGRAGVRHWLEVKEHVEHGCLCPSQVMNLKAGLIATFVNLNAREERSIPALKVTQAPLHLLPAKLAHDGALLAGVSVFHATAKSWNDGCWVDFSPLPIDCLVMDEAACSAARSRLLPLAWKALALAIPQLDKPLKEGLYPVEVPHEIVWNAF